ncbi:MAG TPA: dephospho-CoA kinase [Bacteroidetes bacterium]|nr:dephospho-CoA kinase [Bacteroidota bacterium]
MIKVALTGNIGSGKSVVTRIFKTLDIPVFIADIEARLLYYREDVKKILKQKLGNRIFDPDGEVNTNVLADVIFNDTKALKTVNGIIHPFVYKKYQKWLDRHRETPYTIHESAILFENNLTSRFDRIIVVVAPEAIRLKRVMKRDNITEEQVRARMVNQWPDEKKVKKADFVIINDGDHFIIPQILEIDKTLKAIK